MTVTVDDSTMDAVRRALGSATPAQTSAAMLERAAFDAHDRGDLALELWRRAYDAGQEARARIGRALRAEYGGRSARGGWIGIAVVILAVASAFPLASSIGSRFFDPHTRAVPTAVASALIGVLVLACVLCAGFRALPSNLGRTLLVPIIATGIALAVNAATVPAPVLVLLVAGPAGSVLAGICWFLGRVRDLAAADALDLAPGRTHREQQIWLDDALRTLRREAADQLDAETAGRIARTRTVAGADLIRRGATFTLPADDIPAGEVIIDGVTEGWDGTRTPSE